MVFIWYLYGIYMVFIWYLLSPQNEGETNLFIGFPW